MARCVAFSTNSSDTEVLVVLDAAHPRGTTDFTGCALVVETGPEYAARLVRESSGTGSSGAGSVGYPAWNELGSLSLSDAQAITPSIFAIWAIAWVFRLLGKHVLSSFSGGSDVE